jgi:DNA adenine methylase
VYFALTRMDWELHKDNWAPKEAWLNDLNKELMECYVKLALCPNLVIDLLKEFAQDHSKEKYQKIRDLNPSIETYTSAARFLYLNKTCFNGLYRVNSKGKFNVPYGGEKPYTTIVDEANLNACSTVLVHTKCTSLDFKEVIDAAQQNDFVYCDPPYLPIKKDSFIAYTKEGFGIEEHRALARCLKAAKNRGVHVLASNSNSEATMEIYKDFKIELIPSRHMISCKGDSRTVIKEVLIS